MIFLANENVPLISIKKIRELGFEVSAVIEYNPGITDIEVLKIANAESRIILTFDRDYGKLIFKRKLPCYSGLVYFRFIPISPEETFYIFAKLLKIKNISLKRNFTIVERENIRQRPLVNQISDID